MLASSRRWIISCRKSRAGRSINSRHANRKLGTQMKATGEVMAIGRTFEESIHKAVRSLEIGAHRFYLKDADELDDDMLTARLSKPDDERMFLVAEAFRRGYELQEIQDLTNIDWWFLDKIEAHRRIRRRYPPRAGTDAGDCCMKRNAKASRTARSPKFARRPAERRV